MGGRGSDGSLSGLLSGREVLLMQSAGRAGCRPAIVSRTWRHNSSTFIAWHVGADKVTVGYVHEDVPQHGNLLTRTQTGPGSRIYSLMMLLCVMQCLDCHGEDSCIGA